VAQYHRGKLPAPQGKMSPVRNGTTHSLDQPPGSEHRARLEARLEPRLINALVGVEAHIDHLIDVLADPRAPWIASIAGASGTGKTALADAIARRVIQQDLYADVAWVSAATVWLSSNDGEGDQTSDERPVLCERSLLEQLLQQLIPELMRVQQRSQEQVFKAIQARLRAKPHLIVVDNLITEHDVNRLLPTLKELANPSVFLLTTQANPRYAPAIYRFAMPELGEPDVLRLVRAEARLRDLPALAEHADDQLRPIAELVGGHPLAIRLAVGQVHAQPLPVLLDALRPLRHQSLVERYTALFYHAWHNLNAQMRRTLLLMPLINPWGETLDYLIPVSGMESDVMQDALQSLIRRNLIDARHSRAHAGPAVLRYSIHTLTHQFIQRHILQFG